MSPGPKTSIFDVWAPARSTRRTEVPTPPPKKDPLRFLMLSLNRNGSFFFLFFFPEKYQICRAEGLAQRQP